VSNINDGGPVMTRPIEVIEAELRDAVAAWEVAWEARTIAEREAWVTAAERTDSLRAELAAAKEAQR